MSSKRLNKLRSKFRYYDNARSQINVTWGEVYAMDEAPPGTPYFDEREIGRLIIVDPEGRSEFGSRGRESGDSEIGIRQDDSGYLSGRDGEAYTTDSTRWTEAEVAEIQDEDFFDE